MSTEQSSLDPQLIEQTKQQIRSLVSEIAQLSKEEVAPEEFYGQFLTRVVSALAAVGGAVWTTNDEGRLGLQYQINLQQTNLRDNEEAQAQHGRLLYKALASPEGMMVPPHAGTGDEKDEGVANPTDFLVVLGPLKTDLETVGVLEVFQRPDSGPNTQRGYLRFLMQMCELATDFLKSHQLRHFNDRQVMWTQLEEFARVVHGSLDPREAAYTIANEGRRLIECDRVSIAIRKGNKCTIEAVSGQDVFDKRSNTVRMLGKLATAVVATGEPVWYTGDTSDMAPQVEDAVQEYVDESHSKNVAILPLMRPVPITEDEDDPAKRKKPEAPIGALIVEQIEDSRVPAAMVQRVEVVCRHSSTALANALEHQNLFLMPVWRALGKTRWILEARTLPKTISISAAVVAVLLVLTFWPADFELHSKGSLEPVLHSDVFAGIDGRIIKIPEDIKHGSAVTEGQLLAQLHSVQLDVAVQDVLGRFKTTQEQINTLGRQLPLAGTREQKNQLHGEMEAYRQQLRSLEKQLELYGEKSKELEVRSPANGQITTWDLVDRLIHRPVKQGQVLMQVADPTGPWELELNMAEDRMGHIARAQQALLLELRKRLHKELRDASPEASQQQISAQVDTVADAQLSATLRNLLAEQLLETFRADLTNRIEELPTEEIVTEQIAAEGEPDAEGELSEEAQLAREIRAPLESLLAEPSYVQARTTLQALLDGKVPAGPFRDALKELLDDGLDDRILVTFMLVTHPGTEYQGRISEMHLSAEPQGEEGNTVLIKVTVDRDELPHRRPGATVNAQVYCGQRAIGYVWFHDLVAFVQSRILFRYF